MSEIGDIKIHNDEGKPVRMHSVVSSARVEHYGDVIEYMVQAEIARFKEKEKMIPSKEQVDFLRKQLVRLVVIQRNIDAAQKVQINKSRLLFESA